MQYTTYVTMSSFLMEYMGSMEYMGKYNDNRNISDEPSYYLLTISDMLSNLRPFSSSNSLLIAETLSSSSCVSLKPEIPLWASKDCWKKKKRWLH